MQAGLSSQRWAVRNPRRGWLGGIAPAASCKGVAVGWAAVLALSVAVLTMAPLGAEETAASADDRAAESGSGALAETAVSSGALFDLNCVVIVKGEKGQGSGFVAQLNGQLFFVTNLHVLAAEATMTFTTPDGRSVPMAPTIYASKTRDLAIIPVDPARYEGVFAQVNLEGLPPGAAIGDAVTVYGNEEGGSVVTRLSGKLLGIGADRIEVDAKFLPGNSGGPIVHQPTAAVIGLSTYLRIMDRSAPWHEGQSQASADGSEASPKRAEPVVRRFGYRLDGASDWEAISWADFQRQAAFFRSFDEHTEALVEVVGGLVISRKIRTDYERHPTLGRAVKTMMDNFIFQRQLNSAVNKQALERYIRDLQTETQRDVAFVNQLTLGYFQEAIKPHLAVRREARDRLNSFRP